MHHTMLVSCVNATTSRRQSRKVVPRQDSRAEPDITRLPGCGHADTWGRYSQCEGASRHARTEHRRDRGRRPQRCRSIRSCPATGPVRIPGDAGTSVDQAQAVRLWSFDSALCSAVLTALVESGFLVRTRNASFARSRFSPQRGCASTGLPDRENLTHSSAMQPVTPARRPRHRSRQSEVRSIRLQRRAWTSGRAKQL